MLVTPKPPSPPGGIRGVSNTKLINSYIMKKLKNFKMVLFAVSILLFAFPILAYAAQPKQEYFVLKIFRINSPAQEGMLDSFLKDAYLPALHRAGIPKAGVFKPVESDTAYGKLVYLFIPFKSVDQYLGLADILEKDRTYQQSGKSFLDAEYSNPPYARCETVLMKAFAFMPEFRAPSYTNPPSERIYELRSYESATEAKALKKIQMFNEGGEMKLFEDLKFNPVFFGQVLIGSHMPNLMYMTTFSDMATHDERWKTFGSSDVWKKLSGMDEYKNTVSKANPYLLHPTSYSDF